MTTEANVGKNLRVGNACSSIQGQVAHRARGDEIPVNFLYGGAEERLDALHPAPHELADAVLRRDKIALYRIWVTWQKTFTGLSPGNHTVTIRVSDASGCTHPGEAGRLVTDEPHVRVSFRIT